jgi:hypothetical protein
MYIRPRTSRSRGSVAQELSRSVHTRSDVRAATWFISHTWGNAFVDTLDAVLLFFEHRDNKCPSVCVAGLSCEGAARQYGTVEAVVVVDGRIQGEHRAHRQSAACGGCVG